MVALVDTLGLSKEESAAAAKAYCDFLGTKFHDHMDESDGEAFDDQMVNDLLDNTSKQDGGLQAAHHDWLAVIVPCLESCHACVHRTKPYHTVVPHSVCRSSAHGRRGCISGTLMQSANSFVRRCAISAVSGLQQRMMQIL